MGTHRIQEYPEAKLLQSEGWTPLQSHRIDQGNEIQLRGLAAIGSSVVAVCCHPFMHLQYSLSPKFLIILLLTLTYLASFCPSEILSLAIFALNTKMPKFAFRAASSPLGYMLCRHFLELWNFSEFFCLNYLEITYSDYLQIPQTHILRTCTLCSPWIFFCNCFLIQASLLSYCQVHSLFLGLFISLGTSQQQASPSLPSLSFFFNSSLFPPVVHLAFLSIFCPPNIPSFCNLPVICLSPLS